MLLLLLFPLILASNIPGFPGVDYPTLASVPTTSFECNGRSGYYSDINHGCQVFHICDHSYHHSFLCPNGTIFDQISMSCQWWFNVNCDASENYYILNENLYKGKDISLYGKISNDLYNFMIDSIGISLSNEGKFQNIDKHQVLFSTNNQDGFREIPFIPKTEIYPFQSFGYFQTSNRVEKNNKNRNYKFGQYFSEPSNGPMVQKTDVNEFNNPSLFQAKIPDGNTNLGFKHLNTNTNTKTEIENFIDTVKFRTTSAPLRHQDTMQIPRLETRPKTEIILGKATEPAAIVPTAHCSDYDLVKDTFLRRFQMTSETYHQLFRTTPKDVKQSFTDYSKKPEQLLTIWLDVTDYRSIVNTYGMEPMRQKNLLARSPSLEDRIKARFCARSMADGKPVEFLFGSEASITIAHGRYAESQGSFFIGLVRLVSKKKEGEFDVLLLTIIEVFERIGLSSLFEDFLQEYEQVFDTDLQLICNLKKTGEFDVLLLTILEVLERIGLSFLFEDLLQE
ncbi:hypothetical protein QYM36_007845 [Artemia franciscana]|uniref:Chitin-binding type-2 domain-containing protein n=1 Tax=Artemia franciscana TaxID=6661 RepID=A0AA88IA46_ARTSF|nr:hypothetical protein QYM36_007845 [Artemia franciscana]